MEGKIESEVDKRGETLIKNKAALEDEILDNKKKFESFESTIKKLKAEAALEAKKQESL